VTDAAFMTSLKRIAGLPDCATRAVHSRWFRAARQFQSARKVPNAQAGAARAVVCSGRRAGAVQASRRAYAAMRRALDVFRAYEEPEAT
jgi:hypothetical protein